MSTFRGFIPEFPDIAVDFFRRSARDRGRPPLACFLSHVHSDHLSGLESLKSPFVYCSAPTKELLLRLERYPHRLNFAKKILESRKLQYKHLKSVLRSIPLETPTTIELEPGNEIQVTLFNANHCTGAVMFLFENKSNAVLYTGDIRSEPWFVNSLARNPFLIEYTTGLKRLDCIYLDTSNTKPGSFPTKAEGIKELLEKVSKYPTDTIFHLAAWTFGYEEVWLAFSRALKSKIHLNTYKLNLYRSLVSIDTSNEGRALVGFKCANKFQEGCLTDDTKVRIHSCEKGMQCENVNEKTVWIRPIVTRDKTGRELGEVGVGGGGDDLIPRPELDLDIDDDKVVDQFLDLFAEMDVLMKQNLKSMILESRKESGNLVYLHGTGLENETDKGITLTQLEKQLAKPAEPRYLNTGTDTTPHVITFPYSRHSSYEELCHLVRIFDPKDIYPCTVDEQAWHEGISMERLFGEVCSSRNFRHDAEMRAKNDDEESVLNDTPSKGSSQPSETSGITPTKLLSVAQSPGSASQALRRKAIEDIIDTEGVKRVRVSLSPCKPRLSSKEEEVCSEVMALCPLADPQRVLDLLRNNQWNADLAIEGLMKDSEPDANGDKDEEPSHEEKKANRGFYWDPIDEVSRCTRCAHELLGPTRGPGYCSNGCFAEEGDSFVPYFEEIEDSNPHLYLRSNIVPNNLPHLGKMREINAWELKDVVGEILDYATSAYDSQDEDSSFGEEYEVDSFIDDHESSEDEGEDEGNEMRSSDEEYDYKALDAEDIDLMARVTYLEAEVKTLGRLYDWLGDGYVKLRYGTDSEEENSDLDELAMVRGANNEPTITENLLDSSDASETDDRARDRATAFEAARSHNWHEMRLSSVHGDSATGDHTFPEIEL